MLALVAIRCAQVEGCLKTVVLGHQLIAAALLLTPTSGGEGSSGHCSDPQALWNGSIPKADIETSSSDEESCFTHTSGGRGGDDGGSSSGNVGARPGAAGSCPLPPQRLLQLEVAALGLDNMPLAEVLERCVPVSRMNWHVLVLAKPKWLELRLCGGKCSFCPSSLGVKRGQPSLPQQDHVAFHIPHAG
jgi:hypothetical protein